MMMKEVLKKVIKGTIIIGALVMLPIGVAQSNLNDTIVEEDTTIEGYQYSESFLSAKREELFENDTTYISDLKEYATSVLPNNEDNEGLLKEMEIDVIEGELEDSYNVDCEEGENVLGFYNYEENYMVLETNDKDMYSTLRHELGHAIDMVYNDGNSYGKYSDDKEFVKIFGLESHILYEDEEYYQSSPCEYFAQAFSDYYSNSNMKEIAPKTYEYIESVIMGVR